MSKEINNQIYLQIQRFASQFIYKNEEGINAEIAEFLQNQANVTKYNSIIDEDKHYHIKVRLDNFSAKSVKDLFTRFMHFLEYSGGTFYAKKNYQDQIQYLLISVMENGIGFYIEIEFYQT